MVKLFSTFSRGTIIFVQAGFIILFFKIILLNHNSKAMSDFHWLIFSEFLFMTTLSVSRYFSDHCGFSFFNGRVPTILSMCVCTHIYTCMTSSFFPPLLLHLLRFPPSPPTQHPPFLLLLSSPSPPPLPPPSASLHPPSPPPGLQGAAAVRSTPCSSSGCSCKQPPLTAP